MTLSYIHWALIGMVGYSLTTLFMKLSVGAGNGAFSSFMVLSIATGIVATSSFISVCLRGELSPLMAQLGKPPAFWAYATGVVLFIAVASLFRALSLGPANVVVPIYGMFIVGGALLGMLFLGEALTLTKAAGIAAAIFGIYLISL